MKINKRTFLVVATILFSGAMLSSCSKRTDYTCTCTLTSGVSSRTTISYYWSKMRKGEADARCEAKKTAFVGLTYDCQVQ
jgi:ABC-type sugar transport system substrate-binding protein